MRDTIGDPEARACGSSDDAPLGNLLPKIVVRPPGPASTRIAERLALAESRNVTYRGDDFPVFWSEARGANVRDVDGNIYLDLTSAFGVSAAGHGHPKIVEAIRLQAGRLIHGMGDVHPPEVKVALLERLCALSPWNESRGILASAGSEAVEIALKTAQLATGRPGVIAFEGSYHGLTLGALSTTAREDFRAPFLERLPDSVSFVPFPDPAKNQEEERARSLSALDHAIEVAEEAGRQPGAVIVEPIQGRAGVRIPPTGFLSGVAKRTRQAGAVLIFDEIFTGFGRTGSLFAFQEEGVIPDLLCLGKALGGGLPLSCCLGRVEVMDAWPRSEGESIHTSTFLGHPLSCAASLTFLEILEEEGLPARAAEEGNRFCSLLSEALASCAHLIQVRGRGMFVGLELDTGLSPTGPGPGARTAAALLAKGLMVLPAGSLGEVVEITPPLTIAREQLDWAIEVLTDRVSGLGS